MLKPHMIHNGAMLEPEFIRCHELRLMGRHNFVDGKCTACGTIEIDKEQTDGKLHRPKPDSRIPKKGTN